jgi:hypothetical protein
VDERYARARSLSESVRRIYWPTYRQDPNVVGSAFGQRIVGGQPTDEPAVVIYVMRKVSSRFLPTTRELPRRLFIGGSHIEVDVVETGPIYPLTFAARTRPAPSGISIGHPLITAGTLGCLVTDDSDGSLCILSNNHVLANHNAAMPGDAIIQPGTFDGGRRPADEIATLKRFISIASTGNAVDAAIAQVTSPDDVANRMMNDLMPAPTPDHPAVGLLFAGGCNRTFMNPIDEVVRKLGIAFPAGADSVDVADIGMNLEKVGRTTEYTTSTVLEIDATVTLAYDFGLATFDGQIATAWMSSGGDSGSVVCRGGAGGNLDMCGVGGCVITSVASDMLGVDLSEHRQAEKEFRERHLSQTRIGRYAINLFFINEERLVNRARQAQVSEEDRAYARGLYHEFSGQILEFMAQPQESNVRLSQEHLTRMRQTLQIAKRYLTEEEAEVADELFALGSQARGLTGGEILQLMNHEGLYRRVIELASRIEFLQQPPVK